MSDYEDDTFSEADLLEARPELFEAIDALYIRLSTGLNNPEFGEAIAHLREIERIIGRKP